MPELSSFSIAIDPNQIETIINKIKKSKTENQLGEYHGQNTGFIKTLNLFRSAELYQDADKAKVLIEELKRDGYTPGKEMSDLYNKLNAYHQLDGYEESKASIIEGAKLKVRKNITEQSDKDAKRLAKIKIELKNEIYEFDDLKLQVAHSKGHTDESEITALDFIEYFKNTFQVHISDEQINYILTQTSQDNLVGAIGDFTSFSTTDDSTVVVANHYPIWRFDKENRLKEIEQVFELQKKDLETMEVIGEGEASIKANLKNMKGYNAKPNSIPNFDFEIPTTKPQDILISFRSNQEKPMTLNLSPELASLNNYGIINKFKETFIQLPLVSSLFKNNKKEELIETIDPLKELSEEEKSSLDKKLREQMIYNSKLKKPVSQENQSHEITASVSPSNLGTLKRSSGTRYIGK